MSKKNDYVYLESPIEKEEEDIFGVSPYVEQLYAAFSSGAKFVAVDGEFGSGKSSIVNLFQKKMKNEKRLFKKIHFVNINFLNINQNVKKIKESNSQQKPSLDSISDKETTVDCYHRYFVNQVANDLYSNPHDIERLFYNNFISCSIVKKPRNKILEKILDRLLLVLVSLTSIILFFLTFIDSFKRDYGLGCFINKFFPFLLFVIFVLVLIYGYGFYKPEQQEKSPMLDIDKCRNSLCKILYDVVSKNSTIYFIIDDLDRIDSELQRQIISLLYNEYYPLNDLINNINLKFIFMINLNKIDEDANSEINADKLFDYVVNISNNQNYVLHRYVENEIDDNKVLSDIFSKVKYKDYFIGLIVDNYSSIRKIKHLFNRIITKFMYFYKKDVLINYDQLVMICILSGMCDSKKLNNVINAILNNLQIDNKSNDKICNYIEYSINKGIIDNSYYIYLYNFMNSLDILNEDEQFIYNKLHDDLGTFRDDWLKIYNILTFSSSRYLTIYNHIYKYLSNDDKILFLGHKEFLKYVLLEHNISDLEVKNIYNIFYIDLAFENLYENSFIRFERELLDNLELCLKKYVNSSFDKSLKEKLENEFKIFVSNMKHCIKFFDIEKFIEVVNVDKELFDMLMGCKENNTSVIFNMILNKKLKWKKILKFIDKSILEQINTINDSSSKEGLFLSLLKENLSLNLKCDILINYVDEYEDFEKLGNEFKNDNSFDMSVDELLVLLKKYGYNVFLDKYIIKVINSNNRKKIIDFINGYEFDLSNEVLRAIDNLEPKYGFSLFYENLFRDRKFYTLLLYSELMNNKKLNLDITSLEVDEYKKAAHKVYLDMSNGFQHFDFDLSFTNFIVDTFDFKKLNFIPLNFWKVDILIKSLHFSDKFSNVVDRLVECNYFNDYINYYKNDNKLSDINFLDYLYDYAVKNNLDASIKANITKTINYKKNNTDN